MDCFNCLHVDRFPIKKNIYHKDVLFWLDVVMQTKIRLILSKFLRRYDCRDVFRILSNIYDGDFLQNRQLFSQKTSTIATLRCYGILL